MTAYCRTPNAAGPCLCAWPGITPHEYADLLETRRARIVAQYREGARIADDPASAHRMADYFEGCDPQHLRTDGDPTFTAPPPRHRPRRDPDEAAGVREWNRRRRLDRAHATVARLAPEFEIPETPLDHGELSIPGRAGATMTDAVLDCWRTYQAAQTTIRHLSKENAS